MSTSAHYATSLSDEQWHVVQLMLRGPSRILDERLPRYGPGIVHPFSSFVYTRQQAKERMIVCFQQAWVNLKFH